MLMLNQMLTLTFWLTLILNQMLACRAYSYLPRFLI